MAVLIDSDRVAVWADVMRKLSDVRESIALTKTQLRAAIDATDDWLNTNAASFNSALPAAAQAGLTASQKARLVAFVALKRWGG